jgi:polyvinyl alcohol dehydrogenase (cytochrome)
MSKGRKKVKSMRCNPCWGAIWTATAALLLWSATAPAAGLPTDADRAIPPWLRKEDNGKIAEITARGSKVYSEVCAACHTTGVGHAPAAYILKIMTPENIYSALTNGAMRVQAQNLPDADKQAVAVFLAGHNVAGNSRLAPPACQDAAAKFDFSQTPAFPGWGLTPANTRHVDSAVAGINVQNIGRLHLKWAVGFEGTTRVRSQPALAGGAIYLGSQDGHLYALDRASGCERWRFAASAEVRTGIVISSWKAGDASAHPELYFGDIIGNLYAVDALTGKLIWRDRADPHPSTTLTAAPMLYDGRLYLPVSSLEEGVAGEKYDCCTFRGSIIAYDPHSGKRLWQSFMVDPPKYQGTNAGGSKLYGPSGIALWNTPALDAKRGVMYFGTGDNYSSPSTKLSDAIVAMNLKTGKVKWAYQALGQDAWNGGCSLTGVTSCPKENGPDYDFGAAAILATAKNGRQLVLAGQKSGWVYALDPENGKLVWKNRLGRGGILAGVYFGMATHGNAVFVPINDAPDGREYAEPAHPGLYALDLLTGKYLWKAPISEDVCKDRGPACAPGIAAAVTVTDDLVFTGAGDGRLRAYSPQTGEILWQYDTTAPVKTVGGGEAHGGSMGGSTGQIPYQGNLIVESGYGFAGRMPGNVLLMFGVD